MKRVFLVFCLFISFILTGCFFINEPEKNPEGGNEPSEETTNVKILNNSQFDIDLYSEPERDSCFYLGTVKKNESITIPAKETVAGSVYYVIYHIDICIDIPWYNIDSYILASPQKDKTVEVKVYNPSQMYTSDAFIILENNTNDTVIFKRGTSIELIPESNKKSSFVTPSEVAIYKISSIDFLNLDSFSIKKDKKGEIPLKSIISSLTEEDEGKIFKITLNENEASLKSITPFDINIKKKIWSLDNSIFTPEYASVMRPSYDKKLTLVMGTAAADIKKIGIVRIDEYGKETIFTGDFAAFTNSSNHLYTEIVDFVEQQDGSIVMLLNQVFGDSVDEPDAENYVIACYNFNAKDLKWYKTFKSYTPYNGTYYALEFRKDTKNKLVQIGDDEFVFICAFDNYGSVFDSSTNSNHEIDNYHYMIAYINGKEITGIDNGDIDNQNGVKIALSDIASDYLQGVTAQPTSAYFDGTNLYISGYENWDIPDDGKLDGYSTTHVGKIWKTDIESVKAGNFRFADENLIYSHDNCLFFSIEGSGEGTASNFVVCGEYKDTGKFLKGCYVTSSMIASESSCNPVLYTVPDKNHCWFNQLCQYGNKIVLCGTAASERDGSDDPLPFVVAFDRQGNKLWENLTYTSYTSALNILPNTIGTYILQLGNDKNNKIHYVNADLLGNEAK